MSHHTSTRMTDGFRLHMSSGPKPGQADVPRHDPKADPQQHQQHPQPQGDHGKPGTKPAPRGPRKHSAALKAHRVVGAAFTAHSF